MSQDVVAVESPDPVVTPPKPGPPPPLPKRPRIDPDQFIRTAKEMAVKNFNLSRDKDRSKELRTDQVYVVWFSKTMGHWKAMIGSPVARTLLWEVTFHAGKNSVYVVAYKKINEAAYDLGESAT